MTETSIKIPLNKLKKIQDKSLTRYFSYYLKLKHAYSSGCIHNTDIPKMARIMGVNYNEAKKIYKKILKEGWAREEHGHFFLNRTYSRFFHKFDCCNSKKRVPYVTIDIDQSAFEMKREIEKALIMYKLERDKKWLDKKRSFNPGKYDLDITAKHYKGMQERLKFLQPKERGAYAKVTDNVLNISYIGLGNSINCSPGKAFYLIRELIREGRLKKTRRITVYGSRRQKALQKKNAMEESLFYFKGKVYKSETNQYHILTT